MLHFFCPSFWHTSSSPPSNQIDVSVLAFLTSKKHLIQFPTPSLLNLLFTLQCPPTSLIGSTFISLPTSSLSWRDLIPSPCYIWFPPRIRTTASPLYYLHQWSLQCPLVPSCNVDFVCWWHPALPTHQLSSRLHPLFHNISILFPHSSYIK